MARYIVCVAEAEGNAIVEPALSTQARPWLSIVEAESPLMAAYQYPGYSLAYKQSFFLSQHRDVASIHANWGDVVRVELLDNAIGTLLTAEQPADGHGG